MQAAPDQAGCLLDSSRPALHHGEGRGAHQTKHLLPSPLLPSWRHLACHRTVSYTGGSLGRQETWVVFLCLLLCLLSSAYFILHRNKDTRAG